MTKTELRAFIQGVVVSNEGKIIISKTTAGTGEDGKLYKTIDNKLANNLNVLSSFSCTESTEKYEIIVIGNLEPTA